MMIEVVCATRQTQAAFFTQSALGQSLERIGRIPNVSLRLAAENRAPLPALYNAAIDAATDERLLVFIHDDVWLDDCFFFQRIVDGLRQFDVIGVAGNTTIPAEHCSWAFKDDRFTWDSPAHLRGIVAHGKTAWGPISRFGTTPAAVALLDGLLIAARADKLRANNVRFDPVFDFHFYDLDFCRSASRAGLSLGVWPIALTHQSGGGFGSVGWRQKLETYREKWKPL